MAESRQLEHGVQIQECEDFQEIVGLYETTSIPRSFVVHCSGTCAGATFLRRVA